MSKKNNGKKKWIRPRHRVAREILNLILRPYSYIKYGVRVQRFKEQEKRPYLVLYNHQTAFDQFFVGMSFRGSVYYLATEDIFSKGFVSSIIRYLVAPIPIKKQTTDIKAILNCIKVAKEGGTIAIAPEGNRTYSGRTEYMSPSIAPLARKLGMPIALYRIEGGYGVHPRWSDVVRKGKMRGFVSRVISPEEYANMTDDELYMAIKNELYVDEARADARFSHKKSAEYLERAIYYCHYCGLSTLESHGKTIECKKCGRTVEYLPTKELKGVGFDFPYRFVADWYDAQSEFAGQLDVLQYADKPMWNDKVCLREVVPYKKKITLCKSAEMSLYGNCIEIASDTLRLDLPFEELQSVAVLGKNKLNIYHKDKIYQIKGAKRFNALKYVHIYHRYKNITKGEANGKLQFLGL